MTSKFEDWIHMFHAESKRELLIINQSINENQETPTDHAIMISIERKYNEQ